MKKIYLVIALILDLLLGAGTIYFIQAPSEKILIAFFVMLTAFGFPCILTFIYGLTKKEASIISAGLAVWALAYTFILSTGNILCNVTYPRLLVTVMWIIFIISLILYYKSSEKEYNKEVAITDTINSDNN